MNERPDEEHRLTVLRSYDILDTSLEPLFERAVSIAAAVLAAPMALVSFVDEHRQWFKARIGLEFDETARDISFCAHTIDSGAPLVVLEARRDARFADNPLVVGSPHIRFYAGAPIVGRGGAVLGTVCVLDTESREAPHDAHLGVLVDLAAMISEGLELRRGALAHVQAMEGRGQLAAIVDSSQDAILSKSLEGVIRTWNRAAENLYGYTADEIVGTSILRLLPPGRDDEMRSILDRIGRGEVVDHFETVRVRKDGRRIPVSLTVSPIRDDDGAIIGASAVARDVTERKTLETELERARDQAMEASRLKSDFLATMSHEIRTPLNGVVGMTGLLLDTELDEEQRRYAETVNRSAEALMSIINDILDFSKIEAGKLDLESLAFDLRTLVDDGVELLADRAHAKGLELAAVTSAAVPSVVRGDPGRIRQVLLNLLSNAIKFTETGEVVTRCTVTEDRPDSVRVRFDVSDTGIGIEPAALGRLFEPFTQADVSTTRTHGGTGLGLAISARLADLMGGSLTCRSDAGRGSTFSFTVVLGKEQTGAIGPVEPRRDLHGLFVLIVDDNQTNRAILEHQVASWGMRSVSAPDGSAALEALDAAAGNGDHFDVALVDMDMPRVDGIQLAGRIRADARFASLPVLLLTSRTKRGATEAAREAGVDAYLPKPVRQSQLYDAIVTILTAGDHRPMVTSATIASARSERLPRVLVAEDNSVNQLVVTAMLSKLGYGADVVADGGEALEAVGRGEYGLILMDCQMPEMDGYQATGEIRRREAPGARIPIVALTAGAVRGERERCLAAGMDDYITKPLRLDELDRVLRRWLPRGDEAALAGDPDAPFGEQGRTLDTAQIAELRELGTGPDGREQLRRVIATFIDRGHERVAELQDAVARRDAAAIARVAHSLAGSSANLGARVVADLARRLEEEAAAGTPEDLAELVARLPPAMGEAADALRREFWGPEVR